MTFMRKTTIGVCLLSVFLLLVLVGCNKSEDKKQGAFSVTEDQFFKSLRKNGLAVTEDKEMTQYTNEKAFYKVETPKNSGLTLTYETLKEEKNIASVTVEMEKTAKGKTKLKPQDIVTRVVTSLEPDMTQEELQELLRELKVNDGEEGEFTKERETGSYSYRNESEKITISCKGK